MLRPAKYVFDVWSVGPEGEVGATRGGWERFKPYAVLAVARTVRQKSTNARTLAARCWREG
jgi:hypothetical protein